MEELNRVRLELPLVLPDVDDPRDPCVDRLIGLLKGRPGVERVHVKMQQDSPPLLCLHYDPAVISVGRLRELVSAVGAQLTGKFAHYVGNTPAPLHRPGRAIVCRALAPSARCPGGGSFSFRAVSDRVRTFRDVAEAAGRPRARFRYRVDEHGAGSLGILG